MFDDLHRQHGVEGPPLFSELFDGRRAVGETGARFLGVASRDLDIAGRWIDADDVGAEPSERLAEKTGAAANVENG